MYYQWLLSFAATVMTLPAAGGEINLSLPRVEQPDPDIHAGEPLQDQYNTAWSAFNTSMATVRQDMETAIAAECEKALDAGDLTLVEMWQRTKKNFSSDGTIHLNLGTVEEWKRRHPDVSFPFDFQTLVQDGQATFDAALARLKQDYTTLVSDHTKARNLSQAKLLRAERDTIGVSPLGTAPVKRIGTVVLNVKLAANGTLVLSRREPGRRLTKPGITRTKQPDGTWMCEYDCANIEPMVYAFDWPAFSYNPALWALIRKAPADGEIDLNYPVLRYAIRAPFEMELEFGELGADSGVTVGFWSPGRDQDELNHHLDIGLSTAAGDAKDGDVKAWASTLTPLKRYRERTEILSVPWDTREKWSHECQLPRRGICEMALRGPTLAVRGRKPFSLARITFTGRVVPEYGLFLRLEDAGLVVSGLAKDSPAMKCGVQRGDVLLAIGSGAPKTVLEAEALLADTTIEEDCSIRVQRAGKVLDLVMKEEWGKR